ncbi:MAG TPA: histidine kinase [Pedobacter sp.]|nr:histidine kinase [Pedobacter sp.]
MKLPPRLKPLVRHLAFIAAYFFYEAGMLYAYTGEIIYFWDAFWHLAVNLCLFYANAHIILRYANHFTSALQRITALSLFIVCEFLIFSSIKYFMSFLYVELEISVTRPYETFRDFFRDTLWRFIYICGLSFAYWLAMSSGKKQRELARLEQARLQDLADKEIAKREFVTVENAYLKSQINSHFLFNTLTYLHSAVRETNNDASETILNLASILRYSMNTKSGDKVSLTEELQHIRNVFNISSLKASGSLQLNFSVSGDAEGLQIIPLVLVTLSENMLKYADLKDPENPASFHCGIIGEELCISISNKKRKAHSLLGYGIGVKNTQERLARAYPGTYRMEINQSETHYHLKLNIQLNETL